MSEIKVYSTPTCPYCHMVKQFLKDRNVEFQDVDVSTDEKAGAEMVQKSGQIGVPQIEINGKIIVGFNKEALEEELKNSN